MDVKHRALLTSNLEQLVTCLELNNQLKCCLLLRKVFTVPMLEDILSNKNDEEQKKKELILELQTRGPFAFQKFIAILNDIGQKEVADLLDGRKTNHSLKQQPRKHSQPINEGPMQLVVRTAKVPRTGEKIFKMTSKPRGKCLIINNMDFRQLMKFRFGSEIDAMKLDAIFNQLGYSVKLKHDLEAWEMQELLEKFSQDPEHQQLDSCVIIILSHGHTGLIYGVDCEKINVEHMLSWFNNENCPGLRGKPKMFFIQACRGSDYDAGVEKNESPDAGAIIPPPLVSTFRIPTYTDMLIAYSTVEGFVSMRDHNFGTWFCQELADALIEDACDADLETILKRVDEKVQERTSNDGDKQSTEIAHRGWNKTLYFNPGFHDPEE